MKRKKKDWFKVNHRRAAAAGLPYLHEDTKVFF